MATRIEICQDSDCGTIVAAFESTARTGAPPTDLPSGVLFWRVLGLTSGGSVEGASHPWQFTIPAHSSARASACGQALDVNGDGYADAAIGAPDSDQVIVYYGGAQVASTPGAVLSGKSGSRFGHRVANAGDINGDGYGDLLIAAQGEAFFVLGSPTGPQAPVALAHDASASGFGVAVAGIGDVDRDGFGDIAVSDTGDTVFLYRGRPSGVPELVATPLSGPTGSGFGATVSVAGDIDGDGRSDVLIGAPSIAKTYVYRAAGPRLELVQALSGQVGSRFGFALASAGDTNGDGYCDFLIGAPGAEVAYLYEGRADGLDPQSVTLASVLAGQVGYGFSVGGGGDFFGLGYPVAFVGTERGDLIAMFYGLANGLQPTPAAEERTTGSGYGSLIAGGGDMDRDGYTDLIAAAPGLRTVYVEFGHAYEGSGARSITLTGPGGFGAAVANSPSNRGALTGGQLP